jgi:hypothetical protein
MSAIEEPKEKRRALGRGLDSLLPSGPRVVAAAAAPSVMPPPTQAARVEELRPRQDGDSVDQIPQP